MDDMTVYKRDSAGRKIASEMETKCAKLRFKDQDVELCRMIKIGRDEKCDIVISDDPLVSRRHAIIEQEGDLFHVLDKDSTNGTYVNNNPIPKGKKVQLKSGDEIMVGKTKIKVV